MQASEHQSARVAVILQIRRLSDLAKSRAEAVLSQLPIFRTAPTVTVTQDNFRGTLQEWLAGAR